MANNALRSLFLFYHRIIIFFDFVIRQLSITQESMAAAAKAIDASTTEKRNIRAILDAMDVVNCTIRFIIKSKQHFIHHFSGPFQQTIADNESSLIASIGPSDWAPSVSSFSMFLEDLDRLTEIEGTFSSLNLLLLGHVAPGIDITMLQLLQVILAVSLAADSTATLGKSFAILQTVSVAHECVEEGIVKNIRELANEIQDLLCQAEAGFARIANHLQDCTKIEEA